LEQRLTIIRAENPAFNYGFFRPESNLSFNLRMRSPTPKRCATGKAKAGTPSSLPIPLTNADPVRLTKR
jgi:hypothetical protein